MKRTSLIVAIVLMTILAFGFNEFGIHEFLLRFVGYIFTLLIRIGLLILWISLLIKLIPRGEQ